MLAGALVLLASAAAAPEPTSEAARLVSLFDSACLPFVGDAASLRRSASGLRAMQAPQLLVRPGRVYDASNGTGHMAVLSFDDGACGTVADDVDDLSLLTDLARQLKQLGIAVSALGEAPSGAAGAYRLEGSKIHVTLMLDVQPIGGRTQVSILAADDGG